MSKKDLPRGWAKTELNNVVKILDGKRIPVNARERDRRKGNIPYYGATGQVGWIDDYIFNEELVLLGEDGAPFLEKTKHKAYVIEGKSWVNNHAHVLKTQSMLLTKILCHYLNQIDYQEFVGGTTRLKLTQANMRSIPILIPPLNEQKRIVSKIESILGQIDAARGGLENAKTLLKQARQSVLKEAFEGRLVPQDPNDESAGILLKRIRGNLKEQFVKKKDLPQGWTKTKIEDIAELVGGGTPSRKVAEYFDGSIIWLTPTEIPKTTITVISESKEKITDLGLKKSSAKLIPKGAVLLTTRASIGYAAIAGTEVTTNQGFTSFDCNRSAFSYYLAYWLFHNKDLMKSIAGGTTFKEISKAKLRTLTMPLPPFNEQRRIVAKIESILGGIDANTILMSVFRNLLPFFTS